MLMPARKGGYGANAFGGVMQASGGMPPLSSAPEYNILSAMVQWVEEGIAPSSLTGVYYNDNNATNGIGFTRGLCQVRGGLLRKLSVMRAVSC